MILFLFLHKVIKIIDGQIVLEEINKTHIFSQKNTVSKLNNWSQRGLNLRKYFHFDPTLEKIIFRLISLVEDSDFAHFFEDVTKVKIP
jgi:hypothetical protein